MHFTFFVWRRQWRSKQFNFERRYSDDLLNDLWVCIIHYNFEAKRFYDVVCTFQAIKFKFNKSLAGHINRCHFVHFQIPKRIDAKTRMCVRFFIFFCYRENINFNIHPGNSAITWQKQWICREQTSWFYILFAMYRTFNNRKLVWA